MSIWHTILETLHSDFMSLALVILPVLAVGWRLDRKGKTRADKQNTDHGAVQLLLAEANAKLDNVLTKEDFKAYVEQHAREHRYIEDRILNR